MKVNIAHDLLREFTLTDPKFAYLFFHLPPGKCIMRGYVPVSQSEVVACMNISALASVRGRG